MAGDQDDALISLADWEEFGSSTVGVGFRGRLAARLEACSVSRVAAEHIHSCFGANNAANELGRGWRRCMAM